MIHCRALICVVLGFIVAWAGEVMARPVDPPVAVTLRVEKEDVTGNAVAFDAVRLTLRRDEADQTVLWADLPPAEVFRVYQQVMDRTDPQQWLELAKVLNDRPNGVDLSESALKVATLLDASLEEEAETVRRARPAVVQTAAPAPMVRLDVPPGNDAEAAAAVWGDVTPQNEAQIVERDKAFAQRVSDELGVTFNLVETDFFLFYTDLSPKEAYEWQRVLDLMYERVSHLLGIPDGVNVFRGKAVVFLFANKATFVAFERQFYQRTVTYEAGVCHQHESGEVRIAFFRLEDERQLKQLMIHEAAHGVVHRYRSPVRVPDWINEGIAEWTASAVLNYSQPFKWKKQMSAEYVRQRGGELDATYFDNDQFKAEYYGTALAMTEILLRGGRPRFHDFIVAIKAGTPWPVALREVYDMSKDDLIREYLRTIGIRQRR